jgi:protein-L-isoaspartate(D-aspartate) O-methyltransferase
VRFTVIGILNDASGATLGPPGNDPNDLILLPLTTAQGFAPVARADTRQGGVFLIVRHGEEFLAKWICGVAIYPCSGLRDPLSERALADAFSRGGWERVTKLIRGPDIDGRRCWLQAPDWCLAWD